MYKNHDLQAVLLAMLMVLYITAVVVMARMYVCALVAGQSARNPKENNGPGGAPREGYSVGYQTYPYWVGDGYAPVGQASDYAGSPYSLAGRSCSSNYDYLMYGVTKPECAAGRNAAWRSYRGPSAYY